MRLDWQTLANKIRRLARTRDRRSIRTELAADQPVDLAEAILRSDPNEAAQILLELEPEKAAEVLVELPPSRARAVAVRMPREAIARYLDLLEMDDAAALLEDLPIEDQEELLKSIPAEDAAEISRLFSYPPASAGRIMTENFPRLRPDWTVDDTLRFLRAHRGRFASTVYLYVVDELDRLAGVVPLRQLVESDPETRLGDIMNRELVTCPPDMDQEDVAMLFARYDFLSLPVVNEDGTILGIVLVDDVFDVLEEEETEDVYKQAGVQSAAGKEPYLGMSIWTLARSRFGWLLVLFIAGTLTGHVLLRYQSELESLVALAVFIPLLTGTGGNAGAQAVTMVTRAIALDELTFQDLWRVLRREVATGLLVGTLLGCVGYLRAYTWEVGVGLALTVMLAQLAIVVWATMVGSMLPLLAHRVGWDPALMSSPVLATLVDATGLVIYFQIAHLVLHI